MYSELQISTNFSFLEGASHPHEYIWRAAELGYKAIAITDRNTLSSAVRAHTAAREAGITCLVGCRVEINVTQVPTRHLSTIHRKDISLSLLLYPTSRESYGKLCRLLTFGKSRVSKNDFLLTLEEFLPYQNLFVTVVIPPYFRTRPDLLFDSYNDKSLSLFNVCKTLKENCTDHSLLSIGLTQSYSHQNQKYLYATKDIARSLSISVVATNDVHYHSPSRRPLQDVLTCIREGCTVQQGGYALYANGERYLKPQYEIIRLFHDIPGAITRTEEIVSFCSHFSLTQLTYTYPEEIVPASTSPLEYLRDRTLHGAAERYPSGIPSNVLQLLEDEFTLIHELEYEKYFLTCYDIVRFARSKGILCQGRGAAANSAVCYCLGITSVDPTRIDLLFARFVSKERREPPDIDIDFEHERREEVIQYIYERFGRERAAIASEVVTYRPRSAVREVGKALGLSLQIVDALAKNVHRWTGCTITADLLRELGLDPFNHTVQNTLVLSNELVGFPRHLSQHVGGFIISQEPLCEIVPIISSGMESRTIIEWDKNDIEELGMLKIDVLALGMLTCIRKALELVNSRRKEDPIHFHTIPPECSAVYDMLCKSDSVGVFQVESRAQMSMLPRLKPRCFYDLVIEVAIVRPGPIQGNMVHPYLRRRNGLERPFYPDTRVEKILGKTLGVPIFQEQAMKLAITLANFSPGEAEQLRRAIAAWKTNKGVIATFKEKIVRGMKENGYSLAFAETCLTQIQGFSEYGFPESHAASFALLVYASAWLKCFYPAEFCCALLNSQPMGFYSPSQIIRDAQKHGVTVREVDVSFSKWDCTLEESSHDTPVVRLGLRTIIGMRESDADQVGLARSQMSEMPSSVSHLWSSAPSLPRRSLTKLARADGFQSLSTSRRAAHWELAALPTVTAPLDQFFASTSSHSTGHLPPSTLQEEMFSDLSATGLSLKAHPVQFARQILTKKGVRTTEALLPQNGIKVGTSVSVAGLATIKQRPGTAKGVVFITLEDELGAVNLIIRPRIFDLFFKDILNAAALLATGHLERIGEVVYVDAEHVLGIDALIAPRKATPNDVLKGGCKSYSY